MKLIKVLHFVTDSCRYDNFCIIADNTNRQRFEVTVASLAPSGALQADMKEHGIKSFGLGYSSRSNYLQAIFKLARWLQREKIDVVQTHLYDASLVGLAAARLAQIPLIIFTGHHSQELISYSQVFNRRLPVRVDKLNSRLLSHYIIAPSEQMKQSFVHFYNFPADKIAVIPHGFDFARWQPASNATRERVRTEFNLQGKTVFGAIGRIYWIKDYPNLIRAFAQFAANAPDAVLIIVGAGDQTELKKLAQQLNLTERVIFAGQRTDITDVFAAIDVFVHASLAESFGLVIAEAMAMRKPVISTNVGVAREVVVDAINGFVVPPGDVNALSIAFQKMLQNRERWREMGIAGQHRIATLTAKKMVADYEAHYIKWLTARGKLETESEPQVAARL